MHIELRLGTRLYKIVSVPYLQCFFFFKSFIQNGITSASLVSFKFFYTTAIVHRTYTLPGSELDQSLRGSRRPSTSRDGRYHGPSFELLSHEMNATAAAASDRVESFDR